MKILFVGHSIWHYNIGLTSALNDIVNLYVVNNIRLNIPIRQIIIPRIRNSDILRRLSLGILSQLFDIIHVNNAFQGVFSKKYDKLIVTEHGYPFVGYFEKDKLKFYNQEKENLIYLYEMGVKIITISKFSALKLKEDLDIKAYRYIYHALLNTFRAEKSKELSPKNTPMILWVSRPSKEKEPFVFLKALKYLNSHINFNAYIVGNGPLKEAMQKFVIRENLRRRVFFIKNIPFEKMPQLYNSASLFVHTNSQEPFGLAVLEAMGMGLPVIVPNSGGAKEVADSAGITFEPGNHKDLAEKILEILTNPEMYYKYSKKSIERSKFFSWKKAAKEYLEVYKKVGG